LISPDGFLINTSANDGNPLKGQVFFEYGRCNPETGEDLIVKEPVVILRLSSLQRVPVYGEKWIIRFPLNPVDETQLVDHLFSVDRAPEGSMTIGIIKIFPQKITQVALNVAAFLDSAVIDDGSLIESGTIMGGA
jgi:hypothetical protein